jgi:hypothetical protein
VRDVESRKQGFDYGAGIGFDDEMKIYENGLKSDNDSPNGPAVTVAILASAQTTTVTATNIPSNKCRKWKTACKACNGTDHQICNSKHCPKNPKYFERAVDGSVGVDDEVIEGGMVIITPAADDDSGNLFALRLCIFSIISCN